jgi:hypothetical protein
MQYYRFKDFPSVKLLINQEIDQIIKEKSEMIRKKYAGEYIWKIIIYFRSNDFPDLRDLKYVYTFPLRNSFTPFVGENLYNIIYYTLRHMMDLLERCNAVLFDRLDIYFESNNEKVFICSISREISEEELSKRAIDWIFGRFLS